MKDCPQCGLVNPDTAQVCDCGHSFQTGGSACPRCLSVEGLQVMGKANAGGRLVAGLLGGAAARHLLYGRPALEIHCRSCGHTFQVTAGPRKWSRGRKIITVIGIILIVAFLVFIAISWDDPPRQAPEPIPPAQSQ